MLTLLLATAAAEPCVMAGPKEPPELYLLSIAPGGDLFSSMGHTALVFSGGERSQPMVFDWGAYDSHRPDLFAAFLTGELSYYLAARPLHVMQRGIQAMDRSAIAQRIEAPPERIEALYSQLLIEAQPANRDYLYRWSDANCATKARDAIDGLLDGALHTALDHPVAHTARFEASRHLWRWPVPAFAWRFITSARLDRPLSAWEATMLPERLEQSLAPLATETCELHTGRYSWAPKTPPPQWPWALPGALGVGALAAAVRTGRRRVAGALVLLCGTILSALGLGSLAVWGLGGLEGVGPTENWAMAGPQSTVLVGAGAWMLLGRPVGAGLSAASLAVGAVGLGVFLFDALPQHQSNGDIVLALLPGLLASVWTVHWFAKRAPPR